MGFAVTLAGPLRQLIEDCPECHAAAYADDVLLGSSPEIAHRLVNQWQDSIGRMGLALNPSKMGIWGPRLQAVPPRLAEACPQAQFTTERLVLRGLPVDVQGDLPLVELLLSAPLRLLRPFLKEPATNSRNALMNSCFPPLLMLLALHHRLCI